MEASMVPEAEAEQTASATVTALMFRRRLLRVAGGSLVTILVVSALVILVIYPLAAIFIQSVFPNLFALNPDTHFSLYALQQVFTDKSSYKSISASVLLALITSVGASCIGVVLAVLARRTSFPGAKFIDFFVWIVFFTPSFLLGEAWTVLMIRDGTIDHFIHLPDWLINTFFSPVGVAFLLILKNFPFVYLSVSAGLVWLGSEFEDAARSQGASALRAWLQINLPLLIPAILSGALIVFAEALSDFGTAATIAQNANVSLITYQIYDAINTFPVNFPLAAALSLLLFLVIAAALVGQARLLRIKAYQVISGKTRPSAKTSLKKWRWAAMVFTALVALFALLLPLFECILLSVEHSFANGIIPANITLVNYQRILQHGSDDLQSFGVSFKLAFAAATIVVISGLFIAFLISRTQMPGRKLLNFTTLITISVPGIILASGYIFAWNSPYLENIGIGGRGEPHFYGTIWILLAAYIGGALPYAIRLSSGAIDQIGESMIEAARVQGAGLISIVTRIIAPIMQSGLINIWLLIFTGTIFELAASELLYPPGQPTMPVRITGYFGTFRVEQGMALAMLNIGVVAAILLLLRLVPNVYQRFKQMGAQKNV